MELRQYLSIIWKWIWLVILSVLVAGGASFFASRSATPLYRTKTTLMVGRVTQNPDTNSSELYTGQQLSFIYSQLARREPVLKGAIDSLGLNMSWQALAGQVSAYSIPQTQLLEISVVDSDPYRAKVLADTIAQQLILQSPGAENSASSDEGIFIRSQLDQLKTKIQSGQDEVKRLRQELDAANSALQIQDLENQIAVQDAKVSGWQDTYAQLSITLQGGDVNALSVVEEATVPSRPISSNTRMNVLLASVIGLILAVAGVFLIEYLDDTMKTSTDVQRVAGLSTLGYLVEFHREENQGEYLTNNPRSIAADAFRSLRSNLEFAAVDQPLKTILVSSPTVSEGKTSVATNLAIVMAQGGKNVILVDADFHRPKVHHVLELQNRQGLSDLFRDQLSVSDVCQKWKVDGLKVITAGALPPNPTDLLGSKKMDLILEAISQKADVVVIDGPPFLITDASVLAKKVDGTLFVVRYGFTRRGAVSRALEQIKRAGINVVGAVINGLPRRSDDYYYRNYGYYNQDAEVDHNGRKGSEKLLRESGRFAFVNFLRAKKESHKAISNGREEPDPKREGYSELPGK